MAESVWRTLGSLVGIGVGSLELLLIKHSFQPGETIHGRLMLELEEPTEAKRLVVGVHATEQRERWVTDARGERVRERETRTRYRVERELAGKGVYRAGAYDFHLPLPGGSNPTPMPEGILGDVAKLVEVVAALTRPTLEWKVYAFLDIPWKVNVKTGCDINVAAG